MTREQPKKKEVEKKQLPPGWRWVKLRDVCEVLSGFAWPSEGFEKTPPGIPIIRIQNLDENSRSTFVYWTKEYDARFVVNTGDLLLSLSGSFKVAEWDGPTALLNQRIIKISSSKIETKWLRHWLSISLERISAMGKHAIVNNVSINDIKNLNFPFPPLQEQKRIAAILNEQMAAVEKARAAVEAQLEAAKALPASFLREILPNTESPLPEGWRCVTLREICESLDYGYTASANFTIHEPKLLRITDIQCGEVNWHTVPGCQISPDDEAANTLCHGDIVFARTGGTTGKSYLIKNPPRAVFASYLIRLRVSALADYDYVYLYFQSDDYWRQVRLHSRGGAQPNVNATLLGKIRLPLPDIHIQKQIAKKIKIHFEVVNQAQLHFEKQLTDINALPAAMLRRAFNGEL